MPNWCFNVMKVYGSSDELEDFKTNNKLSGNCLSFTCISPRPDDVEWYLWNVTNWGTKWDACDPILVENDDYLEYSFNTAWSPPTEWLEKCAEKYPNLKIIISCSEENEWLVKYNLERGKLIQLEYFDTKEDYLEDIISKSNLTVYDLLILQQKIHSNFPDDDEAIYDTELYEIFPDIKNIINNDYDIAGYNFITFLDNYIDEIEACVILVQSKIRQHIAKKRFLKKSIEYELVYLPPKNQFLGGIKYQETKCCFNTNLHKII